MVGCVVGAVAGLVLWLWRSAAERRFFGDRYVDDAEIHYILSGGLENRSLPFGPFLILGALAWIFGPTAWHREIAEVFATLTCFPNPYPCQQL